MAAPGRLNPLLSETRPPSRTRGDDIGAIDRDDLQGDPAVVDQHQVAGADITR
jgi:hypothetical protein